MAELTQTGSPKWLDFDYNPILDIMESFDFAHVQKVMHFLDWKWHISADEKRVPTLSELKHTAEMLLVRVLHQDKENDDARYAASGGFVAWRHGEVLRLYFSIEEWASHEQLA